MAREGNLEAPPAPDRLARPEFWNEDADVQGDGAHLRHLPRLSPLREPVRLVPHIV
jgi:hypothetical protein